MIPMHTFTYAMEHWPGLLNGDLVRYGAILKDVNTGRIVGHLQETGGLQSLLSHAAPFTPPPLNAVFGAVGAVTGVVGVGQNIGLSRKLNEIQQTLSVMQALGAATLVSSVVGLGATVVGTMMVLRRIDGVSGRVESLGDRIDALPTILRDDRLQDTLDQIRHALQRLSEVEERPGMGHRVAESEEERLDESFRVLARGVRQASEENARIDPEMLRSILAGMMISADAVATVRLRYDGPKAAKRGAERHYTEFENAVGTLTPDVIRQRTTALADESSETVASLVGDIREMRARLASQVMLHETIDKGAIHGNAFLDRVAGESDEPWLFLPVSGAGF